MRPITIVSALAAALVATGAAAEEKFRVKLSGYEEVPAVSTAASGRLDVAVHRDGRAFDWVLSYSGLQGDVRQAHIHFAQRGVNGGVVVWLCGTSANPGPAGTPTCPAVSGVVSGTAMSADVQAAGAQQIAAGEIEEVIAAMRAGVAYVNVHTSASPGGEIRGQLGGHDPIRRGHD